MSEYSSKVKLVIVFILFFFLNNASNVTKVFK